MHFLSSWSIFCMKILSYRPDDWTEERTTVLRSNSQNGHYVPVVIFERINADKKNMKTKKTETLVWCSQVGSGLNSCPSGRQASSADCRMLNPYSAHTAPVEQPSLADVAPGSRATVQDAVVPHHRGSIAVLRADLLAALRPGTARRSMPSSP